MPSAGAIHLVGSRNSGTAATSNTSSSSSSSPMTKKYASNETTVEPGKIKLRDNDDDKNNICAIKDQSSVAAASSSLKPSKSNRSHATANVPPQSFSSPPPLPFLLLAKVKGKCESRALFAYLSVAGLILILCSSVLFIGLWYGSRCTNAPGSSEYDDDASVFHRHLTSESSVEEIRRITRNVILEEMPSLFTVIYGGDKSAFLRTTQFHDNDAAAVAEDEDDDEDATVKNERKMVRTKRSNHVQNHHHHHQPLQQQQQSADQPSGHVVEFFNPKLRHDIEKKDAEFLKRTGAKGAAPGGDTWVWLTSYSRIPAEAITGFCRATKEYCPPGPPGHPGIPGPKGNRGDVGLPGPPGMDGKEGITGPRGPNGQRGLPGTAGLDGRDGVPGEPGLDGIPGRAGADGIPGRDGKDGANGVDGRNGDHGRDGSVGPIGPPGPPGIPGEKGLSGPRGRAGKPGTNGTPGIPGITAYKVKVNGTESRELLIPPSITGMDDDELQKAIIVREGENLRLRCAAIGTPRPDIEWHRLDNRPISYGSWEASSMSGHTLNITKIQRTHMGIYRCFADNGIPPAANATFNLEVQFEPLIRVRHQNVTAANGSQVVLECEVEAFPDPVRYWERVSDGRLLDPGMRYQIETTNDGSYKSTMRLRMTVLTEQDYGEYRCVCKNEMGTTKGVFFVEVPTTLQQPLPQETPVIVFGKQPPPKLTIEDLCPPPACKECPDTKEKCKDTIMSLHDLIGLELEISATGKRRYEGLSPRSMDVILYAVGKPVYHKAVVDQKFGAWMKDSLPNDRDVEKIWVTKENETGKLYEFENKDEFRKNTFSKTYRLDKQFHGNAHTVYNNSFYYQEANQSRVVRLALRGEKQSTLHIPYAAYTGPRRLYKSDYNYFDFNVDENGLWLIHGLPDSNNTIVSKLGTGDRMDIQYSWNITVNHRKVGEMFIVSGVLYAIDSDTDRNTKIRFALDLYKSKLLDSALTFNNPFRKTTSVAYNARTKELFTWDNGNQLTYPIRYHSIGYDAVSGEKQEENSNSNVRTGYEKYSEDLEAV